jgi:hypothetical protein
VGTSPCTREVNGTTRSTPCPTGWTGNYTEQEIITQVLPEPWNVGNILTQSTRWVVVDSTQCSRERTETTVEACPFGGISQTKQRTVRETMAPDLSNVQTSSAGAWSEVPGKECPILIQDDFRNLCEGSRIRVTWEQLGGCSQSLGNNALNQRKKCPWGNVRRCSYPQDEFGNWQDNFGKWCEASRLRVTREQVGGCRMSIFSKGNRCPWVRRCS